MLALRLILLCLFLMAPGPVFAWQATVVSVQDGDLITAYHDGREVKLRLFGVDTPDDPQEFGREAREWTSRRVKGRVLEATPVSTDRHGNIVAIISVDGVILNRDLAESGFAWVSNCNRSECGEWKEAEAEARRVRIGLWAGDNPLPPWTYRSSGGNQVVASQDEKRLSAEEARRDATVVYTADIVKYVYHSPECPEYRCSNCIGEFKGRSKAEKARYKPCPICAQ